MELAPIREAKRRREQLLGQLSKVIPSLKERGVEKITVYGSILNEDRFQWISDIDLALSGKQFSFREQLQIISLLSEIFGDDGFDAVFLTGEEFIPRQEILDAISREGVDAEQFLKGS
ncbi:MAG: nucleotidyltransferase domain-containing protein [Deltaproteobacteria bacterium]|nr:nucleotidyltransferase domain-containing protein [Deltaproteobacteria bacterium]